MPPAKPISTDVPADPGAGRRPVLGLGGTVDYEVHWDETIVQGLVDRYGIDAGELDRWAPITDERSLLTALLGFVASGTGGERFVASPAVVEAFAAHFPRSITLGGTCVRAALAMDRLGLSSTVHLVSIDDHVRRLLPDRIDHLCSATADSTDPHLIVQFGAGTGVRVGGTEVRSAHPNRVILVNDLPNELLVVSDELAERVADAPVFLVSGFNTMKDADLLADRLDRVREAIGRVPSDGVVLYEDAGFHDPSMSAQVRAGIVDVVDLYSLNEDEMQGYLGRNLDLLDPVAMAAALEDLQRLIPARTLVVHTKYWAVALGEDSARWAGVLRGGITMAGTRFAHGDDFTADDHARTGAGPRNPDGAVFAAALNRRLDGGAHCEPALSLDVARPTTIGLGDVFVGGMIAALIGVGVDEDEPAGQARRLRANQ